MAGTGKSDLTLVVSAYNSATTIRRCLDSLVRQTLRGFDVIVVDDGSADGTAAICREYLPEFSGRLTVLEQENSGLYRARIAGCVAATTEYVAFVDGDDWVAPNAYELALGAATSGGFDVVVYHYKEVTDDNVKIVCRRGFPATATGSASELLQEPWPIFMFNKLYRRTLFDGVDAEVPTKGQLEDAAFNMQVFAKGPSVGFVDEYLYYYFKHGASLSAGAKFARSPRAMDYFDTAEYLWARAWPSSEYRNLVRSYLVRSIRWGLNDPQRWPLRGRYIDFLADHVDEILDNPSVRDRDEVARIAGRGTIPKRLVALPAGWGRDDGEAKTSEWGAWVDGLHADYEIVREFPLPEDATVIRRPPLHDEICEAGDESEGECPIVDVDITHLAAQHRTEYLTLLDAYEHGGVFVARDAAILGRLDGVRALEAFFASDGRTAIATHVFGCKPGSAVVAKLIRTYERPGWRAALPLVVRITSVLEQDRHRLTPPLTHARGLDGSVTVLGFGVVTLGVGRFGVVREAGRLLEGNGTLSLGVSDFDAVIEELERLSVRPGPTPTKSGYYYTAVHDGIERVLGSRAVSTAWRPVRASIGVARRFFGRPARRTGLS